MKLRWKPIRLWAVAILMAAYISLAMSVWHSPDDDSTACSNVSVEIEKDIVEGFLDENDVRNLLESQSIYPLGQPMSAINVREIEEAVEANPFVYKAEAYKAQGGTVVVRLKQRMPVVHVMAENGENYYVDDNGTILENTRYPANIVVATGRISREFASTQLTPMCRTIVRDPFWHNQIEQISVGKDLCVELVPRVGNHLIYIGAIDKVDQKLDNLRKFYVHGLSKIGWNKYSRISVEYLNQVICEKKTAPKTDNS